MKRVWALCLILESSLAGAWQTSSPANAPTGPPPATQKRDLKYTNEGDLAKPAPPAKAAIPRSYALVVGISEYQNLAAQSQLEFADRDAEAVYTVLISAEGGQFPPENVHKLIGANATLANLRHELETWLPSVSKDDDRVLIYFAGHGFIENGRAFLAPSDISPADIEHTAYPMDSLGADIAGKIKGKWKVLLTDACHSGAITPEADRAQVNQALHDLNKSLFSLTASRDREQSLESKSWGTGHGIFTYYVVKGMEGEADVNGDGIVTADELAEYVRENVRQVTNSRQNPTSDRGSFDAGMVLAYNPTRIHSANLPAPKAGTLVIETNMDGVEVWVDGVSQGVVNKDKALHLPGMQPGAHTIKGVHVGYQPDGPREEQIYPGQDTTVSLRILIAKPPKRAAVEHFDRGMTHYAKGFEQNYKAAVEEFQQALSIDPQYSRAALYLGRAYSALYDPDSARKYIKIAIDNDPDYLEARDSYASVLLDSGDLDEAIRQLNVVTTRDPHDGTAWYLLSEAFRRKDDYVDGVKAGEQATLLTPNNAEAHLWLAECLRLLNRTSQAEDHYKQSLLRSNFDSGLAGKLNYYALGFLIGAGKKTRATQQDIWKELRSQANFGICVCEWKEKRIDSAIQYCQTALSYDPNDLYSHYRLGVLYVEKFNEMQAGSQHGALALLAAARKHFSDVVTTNPDWSEADKARKNVLSIDRALAGTGKPTP